MNTRMKLVLVIAATSLVPASVPAALITNDLGDRGDGFNVVQIYTDGSAGNTGSWTVPAGVTSVEVLVVGGGGAGARGGAFGPTGGSPGGGAGGLYYSSFLAVTPGSAISLSVGAGAPTSTSSGSGANGGDSLFGSIIAYGGQGGQVSTNQGGNQGGYSINGGSSVTPGFLGGTGNGATGGAGGSQNGRNGVFASAYGGAGVLGSNVPITGSFGVIGANGLPISGQYGNMVGYVGGGSAGYDGKDLGAEFGESYGGGSGTEPEGVAGTAGFNLLGGGGGGGRSANGGAGGSGVIYVAYQVPEPSTYALLGVVGAATVMLRRRFSR